jgi:predicted phage terminase large subunit-like protein
MPLQPTEKQGIFMALPHYEVLYGGAAGGGKSVGLLLGAAQHVDYPGYAALLLRRTFTDLALPGALIDLSHQWWDHMTCVWSEQRKTWTFPSGATVTFGFLESERDKYRYQSAQFQYIGFDELTQFSETQYQYLLSRIRRLEGSPIPMRARSATNPGGVGHGWVKRRFVQDDQGPVRNRERVFIRALLEDNRHLDRNYSLSLDQLDPVTRRQLKYGDWTVALEGRRFHRDWWKIEDRTVNRDRPKEEGYRPWTSIVRTWDLAATEARPGKDPDWTVGLQLLRDGDGEYLVSDIVRIRASTLEVEQTLRRTADSDAELASQMGLSCTQRVEQEPGSSGVMTVDHIRRRVLDGHRVVARTSTGNKEIRANPVSAAVEERRVAVRTAPWTRAFIEECELFPNSDHDDQVDALAMAYNWLNSKVVEGALAV